MKISKKKIVCIILAAITTFGLTACRKDVNKSPSSNTVEQLKIVDREYFSNAKDANGNDLKLIENGQSEYVIVCPEKPNSFEKLATNGRPLSTDVKKLFDTRKDAYLHFADVRVDNNASPEDAADQIIKEFGL